MAGAFAWISEIVNWVGRFFPRWHMLDSTQGAVKTAGFFLPPWLRRYKESIRVTSCGPGLHWWWPVTTVFEVYPISFQTDNLPAQTIETADGQSVTVGGMISYRVMDVQKLLTQCHSPERAIQTITLPVIHQVVCRLSWDALKQEQRKGTINTKLRNMTQKRLADFGIAVESVELTDMVKVRALRLIQSTQNDMGV